MMHETIFEKELFIPSYLVDRETFLTIPALFSLMQEISWEHVELHGAGSDYLKQFNFFWALVRMHVEISRLPKWKEKIIIKTWGKKVDLLTHPRDYEIYDVDGNLLVAATSHWVIFDATYFKPQLLPELNFTLYTCNNRHAIEEKAPKIKKIDISSSVPQFHPVLYSDIDMHQHTNNAKYLQWFIDNIEIDDFRIEKIKNITVNYLSQSKIGDFYGIIVQNITEQHLVSTIFSKEDDREFCRIEVNLL
ncbi:MAG TPA: thioesterase [Bacteroidales bacterium]|nr:thioesterase [Bacteroidales bacterium]HOS57717.1 thioesterase [Bacteroidales bacterium]HRR04069.1 thioesterase [Bacteroidales bacterium]HRT14348.1 thioesterase [Bacteroidales bacterium]